MCSLVCARELQFASILLHQIFKETHSDNFPQSYVDRFGSRWCTEQFHGLISQFLIDANGSSTFSHGAFRSSLTRYYFQP